MQRLGDCGLAAGHGELRGGLPPAGDYEMQGILVHTLKSWSKMAEARKASKNGAGSRFFNSFIEFTLGMGESRVMCR